jgi:biotin-dependent carboxylase-like uncharacterized protein
MSAIEVLRNRGLTTVQDLGRPGLAHLGVPPSGAVDARSLHLANRLVGNDPGAAGLELTLAGPDLRFSADAVVALTGAPMDASVGTRSLGFNKPAYVRAGEIVKLGAATGGARGYLAVRGGIDVTPVLGSRATDLLTGLGPAPLAVGDAVPVGTPLRPMPGVDLAPVPGPEPEPRLKIRLGPRADWFAPSAIAALCEAGFRVAGSSNRIGVRLNGPPLERLRDGELLSEGIVTGAIQVPPSGQPILLLTDHPTTGGYPVIAVVAENDVSAAGQLRPGQLVRFSASDRT